MRTAKFLLLPVAMVLAVALNPKALGQEFLKPVQHDSASSFLDVTPVAASDGPQGSPVGVLVAPERSVAVTSAQLPIVSSGLPVAGLPMASAGLLAPASVNQYQEIPTIEGMTYGFSQGHGLEFNPHPTNNTNGAYGAYVLPTVSTGAVDINTVDCPFTGRELNRYSINGGWVYIRGLGWRDLLETPPWHGHAILSPRNPRDPHDPQRRDDAD
jgi:hypothetical protein